MMYKMYSFYCILLPSQQVDLKHKRLQVMNVTVVFPDAPWLSKKYVRPLLLWKYVTYGHVAFVINFYNALFTDWLPRHLWWLFTNRY